MDEAAEDSVDQVKLANIREIVDAEIMGAVAPLRADVAELRHKIVNTQTGVGGLVPLLERLIILGEEDRREIADLKADVHKIESRSERMNIATFIGAGLASTPAFFLGIVLLFPERMGILLRATIGQ